MREITAMKPEYLHSSLELVEQVFTEHENAQEGKLVRRLVEEIRSKKYYLPEMDLPSLDEELLLRSDAALAQCDFDRCAAYLAICEKKSPRWHYLSGNLLFAKKEFSLARPHFEAAWELDHKACCSRLEDCCREMGDFAGAYFYACKLRELNRF